MGGELAAIPGIARIQPVRNARVMFRGTPVMIVAIDVASIAETARRPAVEGDDDEMYRRTAAGRGLLLSDNLAPLHHLHAGDTIERAAPNGVTRLPIAGIVVDYSD